jgi:hypothetical protein
MIRTTGKVDLPFLRLTLVSLVLRFASLGMLKTVDELVSDDNNVIEMRKLSGTTRQLE